MPVPLLDTSRQHGAIRSEVLAAIEEIVDSGRFVLGRPALDFEAATANYCGVKHAVGVSSGTDALLVALMALDIGPGDEVIVPSFTFFATAGVVARVGAKPVFVDIDPATFNIDPDAAGAAMTDRTRAVIPVHLFGQCAEMDQINRLAGVRGITVIEDAAQAIGARYHDRPAGSLGHLGAHSFYPTKNLGAFGDAGLCTTDDEALAERIRCLRLHGEAGEYQHTMVGGNFRLDAMQAAVLNIKLRHLEEYAAARRERACRYHELLEGLPIQLPQAAEGCFHVYNQYTIRSDRRDELAACLREVEIGCRVYYPIPLHLQPCFAELGCREGDLPESERACREVLSLPIYPDLTATQQEEVAGAIREFFE